jgi:cysteine synthase A
VTVTRSSLGLFDDIVDQAVLDRTVERFQERKIILPTFTQLADPTLIPTTVTDALEMVGPDEAHPLNLWRVHWFNDGTRVGRVDTPEYLELPGELTGVEARILITLGNRFPMIGAHKVLAAYSCLVPRLVAGAFDPTADRAIWPSTGNYARGGVAISRILGCRGVAVLPEGMSQERFEWLESWIAQPEDIIRTFGTESNVKEIYDACRELAEDPKNVILNQFSEFSNHLGHYRVTGPALQCVFEDSGAPRLWAFVAASGSAGTLGAGDYLKQRFGSRIVPVEALECPTMLYNGYGSHNIQGIGDKHIPLIHNVSNSDDVVAVSDRATDNLLLLFNTEAGKEHLVGQGVDPMLVDQLRHLGLSSICNLLASIKVAKHHRLDSDDAIVTVATDGSEMYLSEIDKITRRDHPGGFDRMAAAAVHARFLEGLDTDHLLELGEVDRTRIFNLGYFTWVEQQGVPLEVFDARRDPDWWDGLRHVPDRWDEMITEFNHRSGVEIS